MGVNTSDEAQNEQAGSSESSTSGRANISSDGDADIMNQVMSARSEEYRLLFRLPYDDVLIEDFNCAVHESFLVQGHMYLFLHHICFYANIFGFETRRKIPFKEITMVQKAKTAGIFPNAIEILVGEEKHFFGSFFKRDEAYRIIIDRWSQHSTNADKLLNDQDLKSQIGGQENGHTVLEGEKVLKQPTNDLNFTESLPVGISDMEGNIVESVDDPSAGLTSTWQVDDIDAPKVLEHFTLITETTFPITIQEFFHHFFSDDAIKFFKRFREDCGDLDFRCTTWRRHEQFGHVRDLSFAHPLKILFGPKSGSCQERQNFRAYKNRHLVIETSQQISDIPFGDCFHVQGLWDVEQECSGENRCNLKIYINVAFSRKLLWKGKIEQSTRDECRHVYSTWIKNAHELLKLKLSVSTQVVQETSDARDLAIDDLSEREKRSSSMEVSKCSEGMPDLLSSIKNLLSESFGPVRGALKLSTSAISASKDSCMAMGVHLKSRSNFLLAMVVVFLVVIFLMQVLSLSDYIVSFFIALMMLVHIITRVFKMRDSFMGLVFTFLMAFNLSKMLMLTYCLSPSLSLFPLLFPLYSVNFNAFPSGILSKAWSIMLDKKWIIFKNGIMNIIFILLMPFWVCLSRYRYWTLISSVILILITDKDRESILSISVS